MRVENSPIHIKEENQGRREILDAIKFKATLEEEAYDPTGANPFFNRQDTLRRAGKIDDMRSEATSVVETFDQLDLSVLSFRRKKEIHKTLGMMASVIVLPSNTVPNVDEILPSLARALVKISHETEIAARLVDSVYVVMDSRRLIDTKTTIHSGEDGRSISVYVDDIVQVCGRESLSQQPGLVHAIKDASDLDVKDPYFSQSLFDAAGYVSHMVTAMSVLGKYLPLDVFSEELIPLYMPYIVGGKELFHSESHTIGPLVLDPALGIVRSKDFTEGSDYSEYHKKNIAYATTEHKNDFTAVQANLDGTTILDKILSQVPGYIDAPENIRADILADSYHRQPEIRSSILAAQHLLIQMYRFRKPHVATIEKSLKTRPDTHGSGGAIFMPKFLLDNTWDWITRLQPFVNEHRKSGQMSYDYENNHSATFVNPLSIISPKER